MSQNANIRADHWSIPCLNITSSFLTLIPITPDLTTQWTLLWLFPHPALTAQNFKSHIGGQPELNRWCSANNGPRFVYLTINSRCPRHQRNNKFHSDKARGWTLLNESFCPTLLDFFVSVCSLFEIYEGVRRAYCQRMMYNMSSRSKKRSTASLNMSWNLSCSCVTWNHTKNGTLIKSEDVWNLFSCVNQGLSHCFTSCTQTY